VTGQKRHTCMCLHLNIFLSKLPSNGSGSLPSPIAHKRGKKRMNERKRAVMVRFLNVIWWYFLTGSSNRWH